MRIGFMEEPYPTNVGELYSAYNHAAVDHYIRHRITLGFRSAVADYPTRLRRIKRYLGVVECSFTDRNASQTPNLCFNRLKMLIPFVTDSILGLYRGSIEMIVSKLCALFEDPILRTLL